MTTDPNTTSSDDQVDQQSEQSDEQPDDGKPKVGEGYPEGQYPTEGTFGYAGTQSPTEPQPEPQPTEPQPEPQDQQGQGQGQGQQGYSEPPAEPQP